VHVQALLTTVTDEARHRTSAQDVLCCLELWMLWLSRYADLSDSNFHPNAAKQEMEWCIAPFREAAHSLVCMLLRCLITLDEVRLHRPQRRTMYCAHPLFVVGLRGSLDTEYGVTSLYHEFYYATEKYFINTERVTFSECVFLPLHTWQSDPLPVSYTCRCFLEYCVLCLCR
jgi:hypothetical protein